MSVKPFSDLVKKISSSSIGYNAEEDFYYFPKNRNPVNGIVIDDESSSKDYPFILEAFTNVQRFRKMEKKEIINSFLAMLNENEELAIRFILYARDIREGAGERRFFSVCLEALSRHPSIERIINKIPELGRFDDLLVDWKSESSMRLALKRFVEGFKNPKERGLACKWAPRKGFWAYRLRKELGLFAQDYRNFIVEGSNTVEQLMCANRWDDINYSTLPSQAHSTYRKALLKHSPVRYGRYVEILKSPDAKALGVKINAGAIEPYELAAKVTRIYGQDYSDSLDFQFSAVPYLLEGKSVFPIVDVSPSMESIATGDTTCKQIAMSLGAHIALNQEGSLNGSIMTFSEKPKIINYHGLGFSKLISDLSNQDWGRYTNLTLSMKLLFELCNENGIKQEELPDAMIVFSDMEFNERGSDNYCQFDEIKKIGRKFGYNKIPLIVFWNLSSSGSTGPKIGNSSSENMIMISGFSTKILKNLVRIIDGETVVSTDTFMLESLLSERYDFS